jgi:hypothetical protein
MAASSNFSISIEESRFIASNKLTIPLTVSLPVLQPKGSIIYNKFNDSIYVSTGLKWELAGLKISIVAGLPPIQGVGTIIYNTIDSLLHVSDGSVWNSIGYNEITSIVEGDGIYIDNTTSQSPVINIDDINTYKLFYNLFPSNSAFLMGRVLPINGDKWFGGALISNGKIYCMPMNSTNVLVIDSNKNTTYTFGSLTTQRKWRGCVLAQNGKIYGVPSTAVSVGIIDPDTDTISLMSGPTFIGVEKWSGGVLSPINGKIYCIPFNTTDILIINPNNDTASLMGVSVTQKWDGGALASNGKIYCSPLTASNILVIDPTTDTISYIAIPLPLPPSGFGGRRWSGIVYSPSTDKLYCIPANTIDVLVIDPKTDTASYMGATLSSSFGARWLSGILAPNGLIYCVPFETTQILVINPVDNTLELLPYIVPGYQQYGGAVLSQNGKIYGVPHKKSDVLIVETGPSSEFTAGLHYSTNKMQVPFEFCLSKYFNKY